MQNIIEMRNITKRFPGIVANDHINLNLRNGEIHALLGENGAGKSTLMSILFGLYQPDEGEILKNGEVIHLKDPNDANALGIGMVHQHFMLVENFTVLDNIILGIEPTSLGFIERNEARKRIIDLSDQYKLFIEPDKKIESITVGMQQRVEILKMLYRNNEILIFDEPTAVLTPQETDELMKIMKHLANEGKSILFITHKLHEILTVADRCTVLRKGKNMGTVNVEDTNRHELSYMMVGRELEFNYEKEKYEPGETVLSIKNLNVLSSLTKKHVVEDVSFNIKEGEIVGIAGVDGNGQTELIATISGLLRPESGSIQLGETDITHLTIHERNNMGLSHIPEDRHKYGLILDYRLDQNLVLKRFRDREFQHLGFIKKGQIREYAKDLIFRYDIRSGKGVDTIVRTMSGGNQQKVIIARELAFNADLILAVQPTRGLDVGAIETIHKEMIKARDNGKAILLVSLELDEIRDLSDRILVMYEGKIVKEFLPEATSAKELGYYMAGGH